MNIKLSCEEYNIETVILDVNDRMWKDTVKEVQSFFAHCLEGKPNENGPIERSEYSYTDPENPIEVRMNNLRIKVNEIIEYINDRSTEKEMEV